MSPNVGYVPCITRFRSNFKQLIMDKHATRTFSKNIKEDLQSYFKYVYMYRYTYTNSVKFEYSLLY